MNNHLRRLFFLPTLLSLTALALSSCKQDPPIKQPPGGDTIPSAPTGMPDWNDTQYNWIRTRDTLCSQRDISGDYWSPKFGFWVVDASPDGKRLLLSMGGRVAIYDSTSHILHTVFPFSCEYIKWSHDGRFIAGASNYPSIQQRIALYDVTIDRWQFLPFPDSVVAVVPTVSWLPGDTSLAVGILFKSDTRSHGYTMAVAPPNALLPLPNPDFDVFTGTIGISVDGADGNSQLRVGPFGNVDSMKTYALPNGVYGVTGFARVSSDGNWLTFRMDADTRGTRFNSQFKITALGIVDLRPGSPTQYQLYRVFPDYTNSYRNCSAAWFFSGVAWSGDGAYVYHEQIRMSDSTTQIVRRNVRTGKVEEMTNFLAPP